MGSRAEKVLGTNPLAFGFPGATKDDDPVLIDLATSAVSWGEVDRRRRAGETLDGDLALDVDGQPTTDPSKVREGMLLPFGGTTAGGKGSALW